MMMIFTSNLAILEKAMERDIERERGMPLDKSPQTHCNHSIFSVRMCTYKYIYINIYIYDILI
jgi:hypothetical protein